MCRVSGPSFHHNLKRFIMKEATTEPHSPSAWNISSVIVIQETEHYFVSVSVVYKKKMLGVLLAFYQMDEHTTGCTMDEFGFDSQQGQEIFLVNVASRPVGLCIEIEFVFSYDMTRSQRWL
jgi:hypothetical protein